MNGTKTDAERKAMLAALNLPSTGATLVESTVALPMATVQADTPTTPVVLVDPHAMPVEQIVLTPDMVDGFDLTDPDERSQATQHVFRLFRSPKRGDRNQALWQVISPWVTRLAQERRTHGVVREQVRVTQEERDLAAMLKASGMTVETLAALIAKQQAEQGSQ